MAGRDKKLKNLQSDQAPTMSIKEQASDSKTQVTDVTTNSSSGADGESRKNGPLRPGRPKKFKKIARKHKLNAMPATSADTAVVKAVARGRGRPPGSTNKRSTEVDRIPDDEVAADDPTTKTRGRKRISINETAENKPANETEPAKPNIAKEGDVKKTVKGVTKKVNKKKLFVAKKGVGKKKVLLSKKILKGVSKQVDPKVLKKNLSAKLKSASEKIELKKETVESPVTEKSDVEASPIPDIKELEIAETPTSVPNSRSSSPKTCKRARTSSDVSANKNDSGTKSPYSTRSERSSPHMMEPAQKLLRNGKQRKAKNALLTETVDQEFKKRRRLMSDSRDSKSSDVGSDIDDIKKVKRLRSYSRDGSEISKCSDTTDFDISFNDTIDSDKPELKDVSKVQEEVKSNGELDSPNESVSDKIVSIKSEEITPTEDTITEVKSDSLDNENNNTDTNDKIKTDSVVFSEKSAGSEATSPVTEANKGPETLSEKSLILDNMSKTFNESSLSEKAKSIRRSARQRKITVKAKEHEESVLAEKDAIEAELRLLKTAKVEPDGSLSKSPNSKLTKKDDAATSDTESPKITKNESDNEKDKTIEKNDLPDDAEEPEKANETEENLKLLFEEEEETDATQVAIDESLKENIETPFITTYQAIDKLMVKLKNFEEQDKKRQEEKAAEKHVMVTNDVVLISKSNNEQKPLKDIPNTIKVEKSMDKDVLSCFENNSAISIVKKDHIRKSVDVDTHSVTLIKKTGATRKLSTSSNDAVTLIDKTLGKEVSLEIRKSIEKALVTPETKPNALPSVNNQAVTISIKSQAKDSPAVKSSKKDASKSEKDTSKSEKEKSKAEKETSQKPVAPEEASQKVQDAETVSVALDPPEKQKQKEIILRHLGLLTHEAAKKAKLDRQKQKEMYAKQVSKHTLKMMDSGYTGTLKTIIKLNRSPDKKKSRSPLKMTFQKSKGRGSKAVSDSISGSDESDDNPHYTIHKDSGGSSGAGSMDGHPLSGGHRKTHYSNRLNNDSGLQDPLSELSLELASGKEAGTNLVIPEKASSFGIHPDRLCQDQCFYCGGKFGLFDTPCHIAQIKSLDRQKKILDCEEKLSVDSCLCDACYRHVDRRANCPSYRKRAGPGALLIPPPAPGNARDTCHVTNCMKQAPQTLRRKWLVKMKKSISKVVNLNLDYLGLQTIPLCEEHYQAISHLMVCGLCKKGLSKNHIHYISQEYQSLNPLLKEQGIPVVFSEKPIVCKACRVFCTLLIRPSQDKSSSDFFSSHRRRLLQSYNINVPEESEKDSNNDELIASAFIKEHNDSIKDKKKSKNGKAKVKKGSDNGKSTDENNSSIILNLNKEKGSDEWKNKSSQNKSLAMEEDIESLISSNKIPVPNSNPSSKASSQTKNSDSEETLVEYDNPIISAIDSKQYEYILQKCSIKGPGMMQKKPNLTQKSKNILKAQNAPAISKVSAQQKIMEKNAKRIQKLGQIITQRPENIDQSNDTSDIGVDKILGKDLTGLSILKNIQLNDECTIETIPPKACKPVDTNSMKMKWQLSNSYTQIKKNLNALSKNLDGQVRKKNVGNNESSFSNPVKRLETNPSISVRELFPGEEEMNLHCAIEFGNIKGVTPEGWEKCNSVIQYDSVTKKLWHELQKPYGNQSSFLRHLILLEKYFRNGDLVLSPNANTNAVTYSESVQNRLRAYDNIPSSHANGDLSNHGLTAFLKNSSVTLIPHVVPSPPPAVISEHVPEVPKKAESHSNSLIEFRKQKSQKTNSGKSLLKTNQLDGNRSLPTKFLPKSTSVELLPPPPPPPLVNQAKIPKNVPISIAQINQSVDQSINVAKIPKNLPLSLTQLEKMGNQLPPLPSISTPRPPTPRPESKTSHMDFLKPIQPVPFGSDLKSSSGRSDTAAVKPKASLPPELIAINPQHNTQRKSIENVLKNIQQLAKNSMTPPSPVMTPSTSLQNLGFSPINPPMSSISVSITKQPETITTTIAPTSSTPVKKSKGSGKQWRPTLIPITDDAKSKNARDVLYQTADGRRLPSLVQVMSGGKPYHITIQDYNKMCVMRREKLLHLQKSDKKKSNKQTDPTKDTPSLTIVAQISNKPPSPETLLPLNLGDHPITLNIDDVKIPSAVTITKADDNDIVLAPPPPPTLPQLPSTVDNDAASILKSVGLKNITITSVDDTKTSSPLTIQTSSLNNTMESNPITVTTDSAITTLAAITSMSLPITSQAVILPKIPKSLTVIPQLSVTSCSSTPVSITPSVAITTVTTSVTNEPPELIPVTTISTPPPPQTEP